MIVFTVGHSTRSFEELLGLLRAHAVEEVADVRGMPGSRRYPHFDRERLSVTLPAAGIAYHHLAALGGRRRAPAGAREDLGWRNESFRAYAAYMETPEFAEGFRQLLALAEDRPTAIMCAEAVPWRCHRWLISDALVARGVRVEHIVTKGKTRPHDLTRWAHVEGERVSYSVGD